MSMMRFRPGVPAFAALLACAGNPAPATIPAGPPDEAAAEQAATSNTLGRPLHILFDWELREREGDFAGAGVARVAPPEHARLDLFGPRDELYLEAALVGNDLRLPPGESDAPLPPPTLLWRALGVFRPPPGATLTATSRSVGALSLEYSGAGGTWRFDFQDSKLRGAEWRGSRDGLRTVVLTGIDEQGLPREAVYRDHREFVELRLKRDETHEVDGFPPDIWIIGR